MAKILTTVNVGGEIAIQPLVLPSSVASNETIQYSFSVTSSVSGPWEFAVIQKGTQVFVPPNISSQWPPLDYPLPSYLSIQFATENPTGSTFSTTVVLNVTTMGAPKGTSSLELVAFQQQTGIPGVPGVLAETSYPFNLIVD